MGFIVLYVFGVVVAAVTLSLHDKLTSIERWVCYGLALLLMGPMLLNVVLWLCILAQIFW